MVLAPGKRPGSCRAGNCEDLVVPPWVWQLATLFGMGIGAPVICGERDRNRPQIRAFADSILSQDQIF